MMMSKELTLVFDEQGGWTALMQLAKRGQAEACFKLVELGANPNIALEARHFAPLL